MGVAPPIQFNLVKLVFFELTWKCNQLSCTILRNSFNTVTCTGYYYSGMWFIIMCILVKVKLNSKVNFQ